MIMKFRYRLNDSGDIVEHGYHSFTGGFEVLPGDPFTGFDCVNYKKDIKSGEWIYLPDITPVDRSINRVEYNWHENTVSIYLNDIYRVMPYVFPAIYNMSEQDCIDLINKYTDKQLKNYDL